jgi:hypothetical protein
MAVTTNYSFKKRKIGHPVRDDDVGDNLDLIDTAIKARETDIDALEALEDGKILVGNGSDVATDVAMSGDVTIINTGETTIGADKVTNTELANITRGSVKVGGTSDAPTDLAAKATGNILVGDDTDIKSVAMSGDVTIIADGTTAIGADKVTKTEIAADIAGDGLTQAVGGELDVNVDDSTIEVATDTVQMKDSGVTIAKLEAALQKGILVIGQIDITEGTVWKTEFPYKVTIDKVNTVVSIALSANETTLTLKNNAGTSMTNGVVTIGASAAKGVVDTASPTVDNVIAAGEDIQFVSSAACSTGNVIVTLHYTRTA